MYIKSRKRHQKDCTHLIGSPFDAVRREKATIILLVRASTAQALMQNRTNHDANSDWVEIYGTLSWIATSICSVDVFKQTICWLLSLSILTYAMKNIEKVLSNWSDVCKCNSNYCYSMLSFSAMGMLNTMPPPQQPSGWFPFKVNTNRLDTARSHINLNTKFENIDIGDTQSELALSCLLCIFSRMFFFCFFVFPTYRIVCARWGWFSHIIRSSRQHNQYIILL